MMKLLCLILSVLSPVINNAIRDKRPNILLMMMDDLSISDVGYYGGDIPTPNIDLLADNSIRLNYHYSEYVCSPTRAALLSGRYAWKTQLNEVTVLPSTEGANPNIDFISDILLNNGYDTLLSGKWHVGYSSDDLLPFERGFKNSLYLSQGEIKYRDHYVCTGWSIHLSNGIKEGSINQTQLLPQLLDMSPEGLCGYDLWENDHQPLFDQDQNEYAEDIFADRISEYLSAYSRIRDDPFFIYWALPTPHVPLTDPPELSSECDNLIGEFRQLHCHMIYYADKLIGRIIDELVDNKLYDDTIIIFLSDNGAQTGFIVPGLEDSAGLPMPFRGAKSTAYEGGIRTPGLIGGGYIEELYKNRFSNSNSISCDYNNLFYVADYFAIIAGMVGIDISHLNIDGIDLWNNIEQECGFTSSSYPSSDDTIKRDEIISFVLRYRNASNSSSLDIQEAEPYFIRAYVRNEDYKLLVNPNVFPGAGFDTPYLDYWVNYDAQFYLEPNQTYYQQYNSHDKDNYNQKIFSSKCYDDYLNNNKTDPSMINVYPYISDDNNDEIYLFNITHDNIEACNIAQDNMDIVNLLLQRLYDEINNYDGADGNGGEAKGPYLAMRDSYNCNDEMFFYVTSDEPEYLDENINITWNQVFVSMIDKVDQCQ